MSIIRIFLVFFILFAGIVFPVNVFCEESSKDVFMEEIYDYLDLFAVSIYLIQRDYVEEVDSRTLIYGALKGMLKSLDPHSQFLDQDSYRDIQIETEGRFGGLGIEISLKDDYLTVVSPIEGTPAYRAGILSGDKIVKIQDIFTKKLSLTEAVKLLRGDPGTKVKLSIVREAKEDPIDFEMTRDIIKIQSVKHAQILDPKNGVGYIRITEFQELSGTDLEKEINRLLRKGMKSLILDLRNNPGGLLQSSVEVADKFFGKDTVIVKTRGRKEDQNIVFKAKDEMFLKVPLVILVNNGSASAAEIVSGAVQDHRRGILIGEKTFGKGSVQSVIPLKDGSALRLTTAKYLTPMDRLIDNIGMEPDITLTVLDSEETELRKISEKKKAKDKLKDPQIKFAASLLSNGEYLKTLEQVSAKKDAVNPAKAPIPSENIPSKTLKKAD